MRPPVLQFFSERSPCWRRRAATAPKPPPPLHPPARTSGSFEFLRKASSSSGAGWSCAWRKSSESRTARAGEAVVGNDRRGARRRCRSCRSCFESSSSWRPARLSHPRNALPWRLSCSRPLCLDAGEVLLPTLDTAVGDTIPHLLSRFSELVRLLRNEYDSNIKRNVFEQLLTRSFK